jgi:ACS family glucarate transporter-like MFS transporter
MNGDLSPPVLQRPTRVRFGVLGFACALSMITYLDRVCFGSVADHIKGEFGLSDTQKGMLFSAFALAYAAFEVPSGALGDLFGPRRTLIRIVVWWSVFTALTGLIWPTASWPLLGFVLLLGVRFLFGMGEAGAYPNIARAFHNWFPFGERGSAQGAVWMAGRFGGGITPLVVLALVFTTMTAEGGALVHWRHIFWIFGVLGATWCVLFFFWFRDRPDQKTSVNQAELSLIRAGEGPHDDGHKSIPWGRMVRSPTLWALCLMYFAASYGWYFNITWLPGYLKDQHGVTAATTGFWTTSFMTGAPLLFGSLACLIGGLLTDSFIRRTGNKKWGRRLFGIVGHGVCAVCYLLSVLAHSPWPFVLAIAFAAFWNDITMGSAWATCLDIGKKYSGVVSGCMNTVGNLGGFAAGFLTGRVLDWHAAPAKAEQATAVASLVGGLGGGWPQGFGSLGGVAVASQKVSEATADGWTFNLISFGAVYVVAALLWMFIDSTKAITGEDKPNFSA